MRNGGTWNSGNEQDLCLNLYATESVGLKLFLLLQDCCYKLADSGADGFLYCKKKKGEKRRG